jgi:hypothetical protein
MRDSAKENQMARISVDITEKEIRAWADFCAKHHIIHDNSKDDEANANFILDYFLNKWNADITEANLTAALSNIREHLRFHTPTQIEHNKLAVRMTIAERDLILGFVSRRGLKDEGDDLLQNFNAIASWLLDKNQPIVANMLDTALTNAGSGQRRLLWKKRLQDSEREAQRQKEEAAKQPARQERTEMLGNEHVLAPHLREHQRQVHAALAEAEARKVAESNPKVDQGVWKARAESLVADTNLDQAAMKKLFVMQETNPSEIDWPATHRSRLIYIERRRNTHLTQELAQQIIDRYPGRNAKIEEDREYAYEETPSLKAELFEVGETEPPPNSLLNNLGFRAFSSTALSYG